MDTLLKADVFFFITTIALVLITVAVLIAVVYLIKLLRDLSAISRKIKEEGEEIIRDISEARRRVEREGFTARTGMKIVWRFVRRMISRRNLHEYDE